MKKVLVFIFILNSFLAGAQTQDNDPASSSSAFDTGRMFGFYGIPVILILVVGYLAYRFIFKRKKPVE